MYERALAAFPLTHQLWLQYGRYTEAQLKSSTAILQIYSRAVRNCSWLGSVWARCGLSLSSFATSGSRARML